MGALPNTHATMRKFLKKGKIVIVLSGRYAGKKAVIMKSYDKGTESHRFGHCLVAGIQRPPRALTRRMGKTKRDKRSKIKPFLKRVNYNHIMPTRYQVTDIDLKGINIADVASEDVEKKKANLKTLKTVFETRYLEQSKPKSGKKDSKASRSETGAAYLFAKLRF